MKRPRKAVILLGLLAVTALAIWSGCGSLPDGWEDQPGPPRVLVSFPPIYSFVKNVAGDQAGVISLCTTEGPHDYKFNANDTIKLKRADLFLANGLGLDEHFAERLATSTSNKKLHYHRLGDALLRQQPTLIRKAEEADQGPHDPHLWLGLSQAVALVELIRDDLKEVDSSHAGLYDKNAKDYIARLQKLHAEGRERLTKLKDIPLITHHDSMGYFADSFGLKVFGVIQTAPGHEPTPGDLADLLKACAALPPAQKSLVLIAVEPQYSPATANTLRQSLKTSGIKRIELVEVDPLETCVHDDLSADWYVKKMQQNIDSLAKSAK